MSSFEATFYNGSVSLFEPPPSSFIGCRSPDSIPFNRLHIALRGFCLTDPVTMVFALGEEPRLAIVVRVPTLAPFDDLRTSLVRTDDVTVLLPRSFDFMRPGVRVLVHFDPSTVMRFSPFLSNNDHPSRFSSFVVPGPGSLFEIDDASPILDVFRPSIPVPSTLLSSSFASVCGELVNLSDSSFFTRDLPPLRVASVTYMGDNYHFSGPLHFAHLVLYDSSGSIAVRVPINLCDTWSDKVVVLHNITLVSLRRRPLGCSFAAIFMLNRCSFYVVAPDDAVEQSMIIPDRVDQAPRVDLDPADFSCTLPHGELFDLTRPVQIQCWPIGHGNSRSFFWVDSANSPFRAMHRRCAFPVECTISNAGFPWAGVVRPGNVVWISGVQVDHLEGRPRIRLNQETVITLVGPESSLDLDAQRSLDAETVNLFWSGHRKRPRS
jgi:hypothetical protein